MRLRIHHSMEVRFPEPTRNAIAVLRLTPRSHEGQRITNWRIDVDPDCLLRRNEDHFGNVIHTVNVPGITQALHVTVQGELTSFDAAGVVRGSAERLPAEMFLRDTPLTAPDDALRSFAHEAAHGRDNVIGRLHGLMDAINTSIAFEPGDDARRSGCETLDARAGDGAAHAQLFVACARHLGVPARCAAGYVLDENGGSRRHSWSEAYVPDLGWVGFDTVQNICPQDSHVRIAIGLDALDAAPIRATLGHIASETVSVTWLFGRVSAVQAQTASA